MFKILLFLILLTCFLCTATAASASTIEFNGKFKNKIILVIDGKSRILKKGQTSPEGVKVLKIKGDVAVLEVNGVEKRFKLGETSAITTNYVKSDSPEVIISLNNRGQYLTAGAINKQVVDLLVDTGANTVALNSNHAKKLGIDYKRNGKPLMVSTASGRTQGFQITLDTISVGQITMHHVVAVVIEGNFPAQILLGMTFLENLEIHRDKQTLTLRKKW